MDVWFVRANGETLHNNPRTKDYVPDEPPVYPCKEFNYKIKCLDDGFIRYGWPNTGDLRQLGLNRLAVNGYTFEDIGSQYQAYLISFASIRTGDLILMPAYTKRCEVYLGVVVIREHRTRELITFKPGLDAYYYYPDIPYECAHRVDVFWDRDRDAAFRRHCIEHIPWRTPFSRVIEAKDDVIEEAKNASLPVVG